ncbi:MAG TPA: TIR domain-containing protein [Marinobacter sp.]|uniref:TIR domain-containing protein n=1 Tax=marine sediment metagenome TaxID=412755 RepID=A0A0F9LCS7_9ZZZZ|nr:TIR domain-containing protein [Marinobacter sp.]
MPENGKDKPQVIEQKPVQSSSPLIFISHDSRDADLAEAFSELLGSVSSGMLESFRSSDKKGTEGIEFGDDWYKRVMLKLGDASDVVCLLTQRSLERPWILYEAGVAKGASDTPVFGIALGVPLRSVSTGPFYRFENCDDTEADLMKLVRQLTSRVPKLKPHDNVVKSQVETFKARADEILSGLAEPGTEAEEETPSGGTPKLLEELKVMFRDLPSRVEEQLAETVGVSRRRKGRRVSPRMLDELFREYMPSPIAIVIFASVVREDAPWLCEVAMEAFRTLTSGTQKAVEQILQSVNMLPKFASGRSFEEFGLVYSEESHMLAMEGPRILEHMVMRCLDERKRG